MNWELSTLCSAVNVWLDMSKRTDEIRGVLVAAINGSNKRQAEKQMDGLSVLDAEKERKI